MRIFLQAKKYFICIFSNTKDLNLPKDILADDKKYQIHTKVEEIFSYRFIASDGDYLFLKSSLLKSKLTNQNAEVTPQFSEHSWTTKEILLTIREQKTFAEFDEKKEL